MPTYECPTCHKHLQVQRREDAPYRPFCCGRCKLIDLGAWMDGTYHIEEPLMPDPRDGWEGDSSEQIRR